MECGFGNAERMRRTFQRLFDASPADYRARFRSTLDANGFFYALARRIGKQSAHRIIHDLARAAQSEACPLSQAIKNDSEVRRFLTEEEIDGLLDARAQIGQCRALVDRVLKVKRKRGVS